MSLTPMEEITTETTLRLYSFEERIALMKEMLPDYEAIFDACAQERQQRVESGEIENFNNEEVWFNKITLELNPDPSLYLVDYYLRTLTGPRLELHLRGKVGVQEARTQMGRIARYIDGRNLSEEFPDISAITHPHLAMAAERLMHMPPALYTSTPAAVSDDAFERMLGAFKSNNKFLKKHGRPKIEAKDFAIRAQTMPTAQFVSRWRDYDGAS